MAGRDEDEGVLFEPFGEVVGVLLGDWEERGDVDEEDDAAAGEAVVECVCCVGFPLVGVVGKGEG